MFESIEVRLLLSVLLGAAIGLERESGGRSDEIGSVGGIRTFSLACLLGGLAGIFYTKNLTYIFLIVSSLFSVLVVAYYIIGSLATKKTGLTNELSFLYTFLLGFLITSNILPLHIIIAVFVVLVTILAFKSKSHELIGGISRNELESFISYAIIALVILPFLPNVGYTLSDIPFIPSLLESYGVSLGQFATLEIINPRKVWFIVVLVTGIDVFGYLLAKLMGNKKSFTTASFVGGFISSTSTTQSLAQKSKKSKIVNYLVGAAVLANLASFFQIFLLVGPLNGRWLVSITPTLLILILTSGLVAAYFLRKKESVETDQETADKKKIFSLLPAIKFAGILILVKFITKICLIVFGQSGFVISSIIASFAGIDAIMVNLADMAGKTISFQFALFTFILVNATNLLSKFVYSFLQGSRKFSLRFLIAVGIMSASTFVGLLFI